MKKAFDGIRRWVGPAGSGASALSASFAAGCVGLLAPLGPVIAALGLDWLHLLSIQMPILYGTTAVALGSLLVSANRHRRPWSALVGLAGVAALLYPFHEALDVTLFRSLVYGGSAALLLAAPWDFILCRRAGRLGEAVA